MAEQAEQQAHPIADWTEKVEAFKAIEGDEAITSVLDEISEISERLCQLQGLIDLRRGRESADSPMAPALSDIIARIDQTVETLDFPRRSTTPWSSRA